MKSLKIESIVTSISNVENIDNDIIEIEQPALETREHYNIDHLTSKGMDDLLKLKERLLKSGT